MLIDAETKIASCASSMSIRSDSGIWCCCSCVTLPCQITSWKECLLHREHEGSGLMTRGRLATLLEGRHLTRGGLLTVYLFSPVRHRVPGI